MIFLYYKNYTYKKLFYNMHYDFNAILRNFFNKNIDN